MYYIGQAFYTDYYFEHHGIRGMKWGVRRFQNEDGTLTEAGKRRLATYGRREEKYMRKQEKMEPKLAKANEKALRAKAKVEKAAYKKNTAWTEEGYDKWDYKHSKYANQSLKANAKYNKRQAQMERYKRLAETYARKIEKFDFNDEEEKKYRANGKKMAERLLKRYA